MLTDRIGCETPGAIELRLYCLASSNKGNLVGGPGFEPGASRSRITRQFIQTCRFLRFSVRFFNSTRPEHPDLHESSAELLHELLHGLSTEVDGATLRCAPASGGATCVHCGRGI